MSNVVLALSPELVMNIYDLFILDIFQMLVLHLTSHEAAKRPAGVWVVRVFSKHFCLDSVQTGAEGCTTPW